MFCFELIYKGARIVKYSKQKEIFEKTNSLKESALLKFNGVPSYDVYNCSIPFLWNGVWYIYGRVEKRSMWAHSHTRLFYKTGVDEYTIAENSMIYPLEDPFISMINGELVLGGTHVQHLQGLTYRFFCYFYRGKDIDDLTYFATGPEDMKDIRFVSMPDGIGVFSRPRSEDIRIKYGSESIIGFTMIKNLDDLSPEIIENATAIEGLFDSDEWGGCNQAYYLDSGFLGIIGHKCFKKVDDEGIAQDVYTNFSFVMDPKNRQVLDQKILATRCFYPHCESKVPNLRDCTFTSGIVMREDGKADLYSGLGDTCEGRIVIDYPFENFGKII